MREFNFKSPGHYKVIALAMVVVAIVKIITMGLVMEIMSTKYPVYGTVYFIVSFLILIGAAVLGNRAAKLMDLSLEYRQFLDDHYMLEHNDFPNEGLARSMANFMDRYDAWIQLNWKILKKFE